MCREADVRWNWLSIVLVAVALVTSSVANAAVVRVEYEGEVGNSIDELGLFGHAGGSGIYDGMPFALSITYSTGAFRDDANPDPSIGDHATSAVTAALGGDCAAPLFEVQLAVNGAVFSLGSLDVCVRNERLRIDTALPSAAPGEVDQAAEFSSFYVDPANFASSPNSLVVDFLFIAIHDSSVSSQLPFVNDLVPLDVDGSSFDHLTFVFTVSRGGPGFEVTSLSQFGGRVVSWTTVDEPAIFALVALGLLGAGYARRRSR